MRILKTAQFGETQVELVEGTEGNPNTWRKVGSFTPTYTYSDGERQVATLLFEMCPQYRIKRIKLLRMSLECTLLRAKTLDNITRDTCVSL